MEYTPKPELPVHEVPRVIQEGEAEALATSVMRCADLNKNQELSFTELTAMLEATPHEGFGRYWAELQNSLPRSIDDVYMLGQVGQKSGTGGIPPLRHRERDWSFQHHASRRRHLGHGRASSGRPGLPGGDRSGARCVLHAATHAM